jgi:endonuclease-3
MTEAAIRHQLVKRGRTLFDAPRERVQFTKIDEADRLLNDLDRYPHAFVIACVMDRQIRAERAWLIPHAVAERLGGFSMNILAKLS